MRKTRTIMLGVLAAGLAFTSCKKNKTEDFTLEISGLENLGSEARYEGWLIVDGAAITSGIFDVNDNGEMSTNTFTVNKKELEDASAFVLTIEPANDPDPKPSAIHILGGDFSGDIANLSVSHSSAIGTDFTDAKGSYLLATPTDGPMNNESSGVWFMDNSSGTGVAGLDLPELPNGWKYEGWAVIDGTPVSTGTFTSASGSDASAPFSGTIAGPPFPGEDFVLNAPAGITFPTDLIGKTVVISVEPSPDNSTKPFLLKPLVGDVPATGTDHVTYNMTNNATNTNPSGTVSK